MKLEDRLNILNDTKQIDEDIYSKVLEIISMFKENWNIELSEENGAMLITHLCIALQRIKNKDVVENMDEDIYKELVKNKNYEKSEQAVEDVECISGIPIPNCEKNFIIMHLCVLFNKENI